MHTERGRGPPTLERRKSARWMPACEAPGGRGRSPQDKDRGGVPRSETRHEQGETRRSDAIRSKLTPPRSRTRPRGRGQGTHRSAAASPGHGAACFSLQRHARSGSGGDKRRRDAISARPAGISVGAKGEGRKTAGRPFHCAVSGVRSVVRACRGDQSACLRLIAFKVKRRESSAGSGATAGRGWGRRCRCQTHQPLRARGALGSA
ncbi:hypothetical protein C8Q79DRAFT_680388 [Trametes meyenii]|nr:hypothetical protein C8Q79DRAFT_680388 [Trametes meyenii]